MALLSSSPFLSAHPSMTFSSPSTRLQSVSLCLNPRTVHSFQIHSPIIAQKRDTVIAMASIDAQEPSAEGAVDKSENKEAKVDVQNLPLESKLQLLQEQKLKMKLAKKIRLKRKRLVRKRHLRKKGRWPPAKMKRGKNV